MRVKYKLLLITAGLVAGIGIKLITTPYYQILGADFAPPLPLAKSQRIASIYSNSESFTQIDTQIQNFLTKWKLPGAAVAISKDGELVFAKGFGYTDVANQIAVEPYHLFRVASISKLITAVGVMKLVEDGKLNLDDRVFGPDGILSMAPYDIYFDGRVEDIKVIHLLNHSGGWTNRWGDPAFMPQTVANELGISLPVTGSDIIRFMLGKRLHFVPGSMSSYSNLGYIILGRVIEEASGQKYETYIRQRVLFPLGIFDMRLGGSFPEEKYNLEVNYYEHAGQLPVEDFMGTGNLVPISYGGNDIETLGPAGGWIASATDLLKFILAIDGFDSRPDIISEASINLMITPVGEGFHPLGWRTITDEAWDRTGTLSGTSSLMVRRRDGFSYVVLFNGSTWKGPMLSDDIQRLIDNAINRTQVWPSDDLFKVARN